MSSEQFGPSALMTPANLVTISRLLLTMPFLGMVVADGASWSAVSFWIALCITDGIDGNLARRMGTTRSGAFLDPLADKVLVLGAMFTLVRYDVFWIVPVLIITAREVVISVYRTVAGRHGVSVPAKQLAKAKTLCQQSAVGLALAPLTAGVSWLYNSFLWAATVLTVVTGAQYLMAARRAGRAGPAPGIIAAP